MTAARRAVPTLLLAAALASGAPALAAQDASGAAGEVGAPAAPAAPAGADPLAALPGRALAVDGLPELAGDHAVLGGARLAHAAVDPSGRAALLFTADDGLLVSVGSLGAGFGAPASVPTARPVAQGAFWGPRVAVQGERVVLAAVLAERPGRDGDVFAWTSADGGRSFGAPVRLNALEGAAREGLLDLAAGPDGRLAVAWMHTAADGLVSVHGVESVDAGAGWSADRLLHASARGSLCPCCPPVLAYGPDGAALWLLDRDDLDGFRDSTLVDLRADPPRAVRLGEPRWALGGCPMSVGALAVEADGPRAVFRREETLYLAAPTPTAREPAPDPAAPDAFTTRALVEGRWPLRAALTDGAVLLWRADQRLRAELPGDLLPRDLGPARRVVLAARPEPGAPLLLAGEFPTPDGDGWRLALRALSPPAR